MPDACFILPIQSLNDLVSILRLGQQSLDRQANVREHFCLFALSAQLLNLSFISKLTKHYGNGFYMLFWRSLSLISGLILIQAILRRLTRLVCSRMPPRQLTLTSTFLAWLAFGRVIAHTVPPTSSAFVDLSRKVHKAASSLHLLLWLLNFQFILIQVHALLLW